MGGGCGGGVVRTRGVGGVRFKIGMHCCEIGLEEGEESEVILVGQGHDEE